MKGILRMKINNLSNMTNFTNNLKMNSAKNNENQQNIVNFQKAPATLKKSLVTASIALASLGVGAASASAQTNAENDITKTEIALSSNNDVDPFDNMGKYFTEKGFTPEQRKAIADYTSEYTTKYFNEFTDAFDKIYNECDYFKNIADSPAYPLALNSEYHMGKAEKGAKELTKFRKDMILIGAVGEKGHYTPNPTLDPINDNKEAIEEVLGQGVTYEQYVNDNAETIKKLDNLKQQKDLESLTENDIAVYLNMMSIFSIVNKYVTDKGEEYNNEVQAGFQQRSDCYTNDMNKLEVFRNETNNKENTFITSTLDGNGIIPDFEDFFTKEGFTQAAQKEYIKVINGQTTDVKEVEVTSNKKGLTYDLSGRITTKKGLQIKDGKKVFIK